MTAKSMIDGVVEGLDVIQIDNDVALAHALQGFPFESFIEMWGIGLSVQKKAKLVQRIKPGYEELQARAQKGDCFFFKPKPERTSLSTISKAIGKSSAQVVKARRQAELKAGLEKVMAFPHVYFRGFETMIWLLGANFELAPSSDLNVILLDAGGREFVKNRLLGSQGLYWSYATRREFRKFRNITRGE